MRAWQTRAACVAIGGDGGDQKEGGDTGEQGHSLLHLRPRPQAEDGDRLNYLYLECQALEVRLIVSELHDAATTNWRGVLHPRPQMGGVEDGRVGVTEAGQRGGNVHG